jgi:hypothetical protein
VQSAEESFKGKESFVVFGHTRMATYRSAENNEDNQPVLKNQQIVLHNGISLIVKRYSQKILAYNENMKLIPRPLSL